MVVMNIKLDEYKLKREKGEWDERIRISGFSDVDQRKKYEEATKVIELDPNSSPQEKWNTIVKKCKEAGK